MTLPQSQIRWCKFANERHPHECWKDPDESLQMGTHQPHPSDPPWHPYESLKVLPWVLMRRDCSRPSWRRYRGGKEGRTSDGPLRDAVSSRNRVRLPGLACLSSQREPSLCCSSLNKTRLEAGSVFSTSSCLVRF